MLAATTATINAINQSTTVSMVNGCHIEYNMNDLISGITVRGPGGTEENPAGSLSYTNPDGIKSFEKLFPITSIIDPRRPKTAGIQYLISGDPTLEERKKSGVLSEANYASSTVFPYRVYYPGMKTSYKYWVSKAAVSKSLSDCVITVSYPKKNNIAAVTNKVTVKFETSHGKPTSWNLKYLNLAGVEQPLYTGTTCPNNGVVDLYYNGSTWSDVEFASPTAGIDITGLKLTVTSISENVGYLGIIEIAAKYVIDVTERIVDFNIYKNSSDSISGLVPVGDVTSNSMRLSLNAYDKQYAYYDKTLSFDKTKINLFNNIKIKPFVTMGSDKIKLGVFYVSDFSVSEFGDIDINALDGAKELQYIKPPDFVAKNMSSLAIMRRLLDSVGFTNYYFNMGSEDKSSIKPLFWYTDNKKTVWQHIQDICKDTQMIATFDENDILQFYPRDYIFDKNKQTQFKFRYNASGANLANISQLSLYNVPTVKSVKVLYSPQLSSSYTGQAQPIYKSGASLLGAGALIDPLLPVAPSDTNSSGEVAAKGVVNLEPIVIEAADKKLYSYSGYLLIDKEIIEFDAIEYSYVVLATATYDTANNKYIGPTIVKWIASDADVSKYQGLGAPQTFTPTGRYRIKSRNAFGVVPANDLDGLTHSVNVSGLKDEWDGYKWDSVSGDFTPSEFVFQLSSMIPDKDNKLFNPIAQSFMTLTAPNTVAVPNTNPALPPTYPLNTVYSIATIEASGIASETYNPLGGAYTPSKNFVIGTSLYFPLIKNPATKQGTGNQRTLAGIAFCLNQLNSSGYFLTIGTTQNSKSDQAYRDVNFYKIVNGKPVSMTTSQKETDGTIITSIDGGELYKIEVKSTDQDISGTPSRVFKISINNKTFSVIDRSPITKTNKIGLSSLQGISSFDYVYTSAIKDEDFVSNNYYSVYQGFLGAGSYLLKTLSDFAFQKGESEIYKIWVKEFGPVAREIRRVQARYADAPAFPRYPQIIQNPDVSIIGSTLDSYTMDIFLMNNSGSFVPLDNGGEKQFIVIGDTVTPSDPYEYMDPKLTDADKAEQVGFDSVWIQNESEAKALAIWMTDQWSKQQKVVTLQTFINPLLQIGDVVEISYPLSGLYSSEDTSPPSVGKYVILSVDTTYDDTTPVTEVVCRSIYI